MMKRPLLSGLMALALTVPAWAGSSLPPATPQSVLGAQSATALQDLGSPSTCPFIIIGEGQSNMQMFSPLGDLSMTASISGTTMTVTAVATGSVVLGNLNGTDSAGSILTDTGSVVAAGTKAVKQLTGSPGLAGTYQVSVSQTVASETMTAQKAVASNILINNTISGATSLVTAAFGSPPLNLGWLVEASGTTQNVSTATLSMNNFAVQEANYIRAIGAIPSTRPIVIGLNAFPGNGEEQWIVGSGTGSPNWTAMMTTMGVIAAAYPGCPVNHIIHSQLESNNDTFQATSGFASFDSMSGALGGFKTWLAQWRAAQGTLSGGGTYNFWTPLTRETVQELATWWDTHSNAQRNDVVHQIANGNIDPQVDMVAASGLAESVDAGPHWSGNAAYQIGINHFRAYLKGFPSGYGLTGTGTFGSATVTGDPTLTVAPGATLNVGSDACRGSRSTIVVASGTGGTVNIPHPKEIPNSCEFEVQAIGTATFSDYTTPYTAAPISCAGNNMTMVSLGTTLATQSIGSGTFLLKPYLGCSWLILPEYPIKGNFLFSAQAYGSSAAVTLTGTQVEGGERSGTGNTITLPVPSAGSVFTFTNDTANGAMTLNASTNGYTFLNDDGTTSGTYTVAPGAKGWIIERQARPVAATTGTSSRTAATRLAYASRTRPASPRPGPLSPPRPCSPAT